MKRYLLFAGLDYYPDRAWRNFIEDFDTIPDAINRLKDFKGCEWTDWFQIVDTETKRVEKEGKILSTLQ